MEPLDDDELKQLLRKWEAPPAPSTLQQRIFPQEKSRWSWLLTGTIRIPVPALIIAGIVVVLWVHYSRPSNRTRPAEPGSVSLADFRPVQQLEPVLMRGGQK